MPWFIPARGLQAVNDARSARRSKSCLRHWRRLAEQGRRSIYEVDRASARQAILSNYPKFGFQNSEQRCGALLIELNALTLLVRNLPAVATTAINQQNDTSVPLKENTLPLSHHAANSAASTLS
jgi:hypothetical protein